MTDKEKNAALASDSHIIDVTGRSVQVTDAMKRYAQDKLLKFDRPHNHIMHIHVTMEIEHMNHKVTIVGKFDHFKVTAHAHSSDMYASVDMAVDRLEKQLNRWKDQIRDHTKKKSTPVDVEVALLEKLYSELEEYNAEIEEKNGKDVQKSFRVPKIARTKTIPLKTLTLQEALMKMELSEDVFLLYRSEEDRKLKVIYRRKDGNYGIIRPE